MSKDFSLTEAFAAVCREQLELIHHHLPAAVAGADAEELHQFRVAVRKTRAYLQTLHEYFPDADDFLAEFDWLAGTTNRLRDTDVLLASLQQDIDADIARALTTRRAAELRQLRRALQGRRCRALLHRWRDWLAQLPERDDLKKKARLPAALLLQNRCLRQCRTLLKRGDAIDPFAAPARTLHKLRIRSKRLRYFLEAFAPYLDLRGVKSLQKHLKALQELLGSHQDATVAIAHWRELAECAPAQLSAPIHEERIAQAEQRQLLARGAMSARLRAFGNACRRLR